VEAFEATQTEYSKDRDKFPFINNHGARSKRLFDQSRQFQHLQGFEARAINSQQEIAGEGSGTSLKDQRPPTRVQVERFSLTRLNAESSVPVDQKARVPEERARPIGVCAHG